MLSVSIELLDPRYLDALASSRIAPVQETGNCPECGRSSFHASEFSPAAFRARPATLAVLMEIDEDSLTGRRYLFGTALWRVEKSVGCA